VKNILNAGDGIANLNNIGELARKLSLPFFEFADGVTGY
jgi:hypothetical protein